MSELKNVFSSSNSNSNESFLEIEDIEEKPVDTFYNIFGKNSKIDFSLDNTVKQDNFKESINDIQKEIRHKEEKYYELLGKTAAKRLLILEASGLLFAVVSVLSVVLGLNFIQSLMFLSPNFGLMLFCAHNFIQAGKRADLLKEDINTLEQELIIKEKSQRIIKEKSQRKKLMEKELDGKIIYPSKLSNGWNLIQVKKDNKVREYMSRITLDKNGHESIETREL